MLCAGPVGAGQVRVVDGDTLVLDQARVRLYGIDAPESGQTCARGGLDWRCGEWSGAQLRALVAAGPVRCDPRGTDRYGRMIAVCTAGGRDLAAAQVQAGAATAYLRYARDYAADEARARAAGLGIWAGTMQPPEDFRHAEAAPGCAIKGNIGAQERIYHLPGQEGYAATRIDAARGEAWFCSAAEAEAAGFRAARR